jgi:tetratricopeptide (TPR) repeat protein
MAGIVLLVVCGLLLVLGVRRLTRLPDTTPFDDSAAWREQVRALVEGEAATEAHQLYAEGRPDLALQALPDSDLNLHVTMRVALGQYREALALGERDALHAQANDVSSLGPSERLVRINLAEALYETGRWTEARRLLEPWPEEPSAFLEAGRITSLAWILACIGQAQRALELLDADLRDIGPDYAAEVAFTRAKALLGVARPAEALEAVGEGARLARRASSLRNAKFLEAECLAALGRIDESLAAYRVAAESPYRWQGGRALLAWGDLLASVGRAIEATEAWRLCVARDPECESAATAAARLAQRP